MSDEPTEIERAQRYGGTVAVVASLTLCLAQCEAHNRHWLGRLLVVGC